MGTELHKAAEKGDVEKIIKLVKGSFFKKAIPVDAKDNEGWTALHIAVKKAQIEAIRCLVKECGADANAKDNDGWTALHIAATGQHEVTRFLVKECGADPNAKNKDGWTALHVAAINGFVETIRCLIEECGADLMLQNNAGQIPYELATKPERKALLLELASLNQNENKPSPAIESVNARHTVTQEMINEFLDAAGKGDVEKIKELIKGSFLKKAIPVDAKNERGATALHRAAFMGKVEAIRYLVKECGADVNSKNVYGWMALHNAVLDGRVEAIRCLVKECGADPNAKGEDGSTALHSAVLDGHVEAIYCLVQECGADLTLKDNADKTPYEVATKPGIKTLLLELGSPNQNENKPSRALQSVNANNTVTQAMIGELCAAAKNGNVEKIKELVQLVPTRSIFDYKKTIPVDAKDNDGWTALHHAAFYGRVEAIRCLVKECRADVNAKNERGGTTALHIAVNRGHIEALRCLVQECKANVNAKNKEGQTALHVADTYERVEFIRCLVQEYGADVNAKDEKGWSVLHYAAFYRHVKVIPCLVQECGADLTLQDNWGKTPYELATNPEIKALLLKLASPNQNENKPSRALQSVNANDTVTQEMIEELCAAAKNGDVEKIKELVKGSFLKKAIPVDAKDERGWTALHKAAYYGRVEAIRCLVKECGADVNAKDEKGWSALHKAAFHERVEAIRCLVQECGADLTLKDNAGKTPSEVATKLDIKLLFLLASRNQNENKLSRALQSVNANDTVPQEMIKEFLDAAENGNVEKIKELVKGSFLKKAIPVDAKDERGWTALHKAAYYGRVEAIRCLVKECGADVNAKDEKGWSALHFAAFMGKIETIHCIIQECGADPNAKSNAGWTALHMAVNRVNIEAIRYLVQECGADLTLKDNAGKTPYEVATKPEMKALLLELVSPNQNENKPSRAIQSVNPNDTVTQEMIEELYAAAENGDVEKIKELVKGSFLKKAIRVDAKDERGWTALHKAAFYGRIESIYCLVKECGADVNSKNVLGLSPLHFAAFIGNIEAVRYLVQECGADLTLKDYTGKTLYEFATNPEIKALLLKLASNQNTVTQEMIEELCAAGKNGDVEKIKELVKGSFLKKAIPVDAKDEQGWTALHHAAMYGYVEAIRCLVKECRADPNAKDEKGWTALHHATNWGHIEAIPCLVQECGADLTLQDNAGKSPYEVAIQPKIKALLLKLASPNQNTVTQEMIEELCAAAKNGDVEKIKELVKGSFLKKAIPVDAKDEKGWTALHHAASYGYVEAIRCLVKECGADVNAKDELGLSPLHFAAFMGNIEAVRYLVQECGADLTLQDNAGKSPYEVAIQPKIKALLLKLASPNQNENKPLRVIKNVTPNISPNYSVETKAPSVTNSSDNVALAPKAADRLPSTLPLGEVHISFTIDYSSLKLNKRLGRGAYGEVYQGKWDNTTVAIKQLARGQLSEKELTDFQHEMSVMASLHHPNIVHLLGVAVHDDCYCIVMEYMPRGSLYQLLHGTEPLSWEQREKIALDMANGLNHLHKKNVLHRDLKSLNVLLKKEEDSYRAVLCDFGLAKVKQEISSSSEYSTVAGTLQWMAPELFKGEACTTASDIYSYGLVVWELLSRELPFKGIPSYLISKVIENRVEPEVISEACKKQSPKLAQLVKFCWQKNPAERFCASQAIKHLEAGEEDLSLNNSLRGNLESLRNPTDEKNNYQGNLESLNRMNL